MTKPEHEIAVRFGKDHDGNFIVTFYEARGFLADKLAEADLPIKVGGKDAIRLTGKLGMLVKALNLIRVQFSANGNTYYSYRPTLDALVAHAVSNSTPASA